MSALALLNVLNEFRKNISEVLPSIFSSLINLRISLMRNNEKSVGVVRGAGCPRHKNTTIRV